MNVQAAIQAGLAVKFVADNWQAADPEKGLTGRTIPLSTGSYLVLGTIYANDLATDLACEHHLTSYLHMLAQLIGQPGFDLDSDCKA